jgi:hypothetical protein
VPQEKNPVNSYTETCLFYSPCNDAYDALMGQQDEMPPAAAETIDSVCSFASLAQKGSAQCINLCETGFCCMDDTCLKGGSETQEIINQLNEICNGYSTCNNLNGMPNPPVNIAQTCSNPASDQCLSICSSVSCCFDDQGSCYSSFGGTCESYRMFRASTVAPAPNPTSRPTSDPTPWPITVRPFFNVFGCSVGAYPLIFGH